MCAWLEFIKELRDAAWSAALERLCWQMVGAVAKEIIRSKKISQQDAFDRATSVIVQRVQFEAGETDRYQPGTPRIKPMPTEDIEDLDVDFIGIQQLKDRMEALKHTFYCRSSDWIDPEILIKRVLEIVGI